MTLPTTANESYMGTRAVKQALNSAYIFHGMGNESDPEGSCFWEVLAWRKSPVQGANLQ